jgi:hypothetical protein
MPLATRDAAISARRRPSSGRKWTTSRAKVGIEVIARQGQLLGRRPLHVDPG